MQKSYRKNIQRDFRSNLNRFLSLFGIVALGVMMLTGLVSFAPSMRPEKKKCQKSFSKGLSFFAHMCYNK